MQTLWACLIALLCVYGADAYASDPKGYDLTKEAKFFKLKKQDIPNRKGLQFAALKGQIKDDQARLLLPALNVSKPVAITLHALTSGERLELQLVKKHWDQPIQRCTTDASGTCTLKFRTHGDLGLVIQQQTGTSKTFLIEALIGTKVMLPPKRHAFVKTTDASSSSMTTVLIAVFAAVGLILAVLFWFKFKKRLNASVLLLIGFGVFALPESGQTAPVSGGPPIYTDELSFDELLQTLDQYSDQRDALQGRLKDIEGLSEIAESVKGMFEKFGKIADSLEHLQSMLDGYGQLTGEDGEYVPDLDDRALPDVPSSCIDNPECQACFSKAHEKFIGDRLLLEELRIIYSSTRNFSKAALSFGDSASGVHGVSGLAWQSERRKIEKSLKNMNNAYDNKYQELIDRAYESLQQIAACENQFGTKDWYQAFGFMYFDFLKTKYKRAED